MSGEYKRLAAVDGLSTDAYGAESLSDGIRTAITECVEAISAFADSAGMSGDLDAAIRQWIGEFSQRLATMKSEFEANTAQERSARSAMATARSGFSRLATDAMIESEAQSIANGPDVEVGGQTVSARVYADELKRRRYAERDRAAGTILTTMNSAVSSCAQSVTWGGEWREDTTPDSGAGAGYTGSRSAGFASTASAGAVVSSAAVNTARLAGAGVGGAVLSTKSTQSLTPGVPVNWTRPAPGAVGSASNPITDPARLARIDLLRTPVNQRMTADGPVGGHLPPSTTNIDDPRWRAYTGYAPTTASGAQHASAAGLVGGMLGLGGSALAARGLGGASTFITGTASGSALAPSVASTGLLSARAATAPGSASASALSGSALSARGAAGAALGSNVPASAAGTAAGSGAQAGAASQAASGRATARGAGAYGPAGASRSEDRKRRGRSRIGYEVLRLNEDEAAAPIDPSPLASGTASDLAPLDREESDQW